MSYISEQAGEMNPDVRGRRRGGAATQPVEHRGAAVDLATHDAHIVGHPRRRSRQRVE
jgi:hypothetical protein